MYTNIILNYDDTTVLSIDPSKTIIWAGAGISCEAPSKLPLGNGLTDAFLKAMLGDKWKAFVALWNNYFPQIKDSVKDGKWKSPPEIGNYTEGDIDIPNEKARTRPRLEYIIGEMDKLDKYFNNTPFQNPQNKKMFSRKPSINALSYFSKVEPCLAHYRIADLVKRGAVFVTTNFDNGVEKALHLDSSKIVKHYHTDAISDGHGGYIYHIHGIATDNPNNLGTTIFSLSKGLSEDFQEYLKSLFLLGYDILFIGYGGVDFFDVEPFFKSLRSQQYTGKAVYLKYCCDDKDKKSAVEEEKPFLYLLESFQQQYIAYGSTKEFFHTLVDKYSDVTVSCADCGAFKALKIYLESIALTQVDTETFYFLNMFRLCSQLNISPGRFYPDWIEKINSMFNIWKDDSKKTLEKMTVVSGQKNDGIVEDIYSNNWHDDALTKTGMKKMLRRYIKQWEKKHRTLLSVSNRAFHGHGFPLPRFIIKYYLRKTTENLRYQKSDEQSVDICRSTVMYLCGDQTKMAIWLYIKSRGHIKKRMLFLRDSINHLLQFPFTRFRYRTHYLSLCRQAGYINAAINRDKKEYQGDIQHEWDICMQTPILFDAGQTLNSRLNQANKILHIDDGKKELEEIRALILSLRKQNSDSYK